MDDVLDTAAAWKRTGHGVALATVVNTWGSSPRPKGSQLAIREDGEFQGSVSGGCVEGSVIEAAVALLREEDPGAVRVLRFGVTNELAWEVGLACGGEIEIFVERVE